MGDTGGLYSGASGLVLPVPNKQFYPEQFRDKSRLCYYSSLFNSIEINSSFYKIPMPATVRRWADDVTDTFRFTFKLFRDITHVKGLTYNHADIARFFEAVDAVREKRGCILVQFPPGLDSDYLLQFERLLSDLYSVNEGRWRMAFEFRNRSWYFPDLFDMLNFYDAGLVLHDMPSSAPPLLDQGTDFVYLRFHGPQGGYRGSYPDAHLAEYASYAGDWLRDEKTVYTYFNNTMGKAIQNLLTFNSYSASE